MIYIILLGLRNQQVYEKCMKVGDQLTSINVIQIASGVYNLARQFSIMQSLNATTAAATTVQNPSVSQLHPEKAKHSKKGSAAEDRSQSTCKPCYYCGPTPSHPKKECPTRDAKSYKCGMKGHFKGSYRSKKEEKEMNRARNVERKLKNQQKATS